MRSAPLARLAPFALASMLGLVSPFALAVDAAKEADILTLIDMTGIRQGTANTVEQLRGQTRDWAKRSNPQQAAKAEQVVMDTARRTLTEQFDARGGLRDRLIPVYDRLFSQGELRDIIAFLRTPAGTKFIQTQPALQKEAQVIVNSWLREVMPTFATRANETLKAAGLRPLDAPGAQSMPAPGPTPAPRP